MLILFEAEITVKVFTEKKKKKVPPLLLSALLTDIYCLI